MNESREKEKQEIKKKTSEVISGSGSPIRSSKDWEQQEEMSE